MITKIATFLLSNLHICTNILKTFIPKLLLLYNELLLLYNLLHNFCKKQCIAKSAFIGLTEDSYRGIPVI